LAGFPRALTYLAASFPRFGFGHFQIGLPDMATLRRFVAEVVPAVQLEPTARP
jgi:hypothetical protein